MRFLTLALGCSLLFMGTSGDPPLCENGRIQAMHNAATRQRTRSGLRTQDLDEDLCVIAQRWANNMAARGMMYHGGGEQVVAQGYPSEEAAIIGWVNSPGHRVWVLGGNGKCGFGCQRGNNGQWYYAGVFR